MNWCEVEVKAEQRPDYFFLNLDLSLNLPNACAHSYVTLRLKASLTHITHEGSSRHERVARVKREERDSRDV